MKHLRLIFLAIISCICVFGWSDNTTSAWSTISIKERKFPKKPDKPRAPSRQVINCVYSGEELIIDFAYSEGECTLTVASEDGNVQMFYFDSEETATIYIGEVQEALITITTASGNVYEGNIVPW